MPEPTNNSTTPHPPVAATELEPFRTRCFWWVRCDQRLEQLPPETLARYLRRHGGHAGWKLAAQLCP